MKENYQSYTNNKAYCIEECNYCSQHFLVERTSVNGPIVTIYPKTLPKSVNELIPQSIKTDFEEALLCYSANAYRGAAALARRTVQLICLDKGADSRKKLNEQIDQLLENGIITKDIQEWAHEVRFLGNDAAHPNKNTVNQDDAKDILDLLESLCEVLYVAPAKAAKRKQKRTSVCGETSQ
jgi:hypothetical protein